VLQAAIANAENNHQLDVDRLVVAEAHVGQSLKMRRFQARGRGRASSVVKLFSHLTVIVRERQETA
jgi:large subunit ribosomal protein L22